MILPATAKEVFVPARGETELDSCEAEYESVSGKPRGTLVVTTHRIAFLQSPVTSIVVGGEQQPVRLVTVNIGYSNFMSALHRVERKLFIVNEYVEVSYETPEGIARKAVFKVKGKGVAERVVSSMRAAAAKYRSTLAKEPKLPLAEFMGFIEYLSIDKSIRPLYYDSVSRCIVIGSSYFCVTSPEWSVEGSPDLVDKAKTWVDEYKARRR